MVFRILRLYVGGGALKRLEASRFFILCVFLAELGGIIRKLGRYNRVGGSQFDATLTTAIFAPEYLHIALVTPSRAPRIFDLPIFSAIFHAITNKKHAMIKRSPASPCENPAFVGLEGPLISLDGNGDRLLRHRLHERLFILIDVFVAHNVTSWNASFTAGCPASTILTLILIARFSANVVILLIFEGHVHEPTTASSASIDTIHKLLLTE